MLVSERRDSTTEQLSMDGLQIQTSWEPTEAPPLRSFMTMGQLLPLFLPKTSSSWKKKKYGPTGLL